MCGRTMAEVVNLVRSRRGVTLNENTIWIMRDYGDFHAKTGQKGARRYLYYDCHVENYEN